MSAENTIQNTPRFGITSVIMMFAPILTIVVMNIIIYPVFGKLPNRVEMITLILFGFLPVLIGSILAIVGLVKKENRRWLHVIGLIFNLLQTLYWGIFVFLAG